MINRVEFQIIFYPSVKSHLSCHARHEVHPSACCTDESHSKHNKNPTYTIIENGIQKIPKLCKYLTYEIYTVVAGGLGLYIFVQVIEYPT